jgi:fructokinase
MLSPFQDSFKIPVSIETDVNIAALGEYTWGSSKALNNFIYLTIGTGIGGAGMINGSFLQGDKHPEMGHIFLPKLNYDNFEGGCPYHNDRCFEGLVSGTSLGLRAGVNAETINVGEQLWELVAEYISLALVNYIYILAPKKNNNWRWGNETERV